MTGSPRSWKRSTALLAAKILASAACLYALWIWIDPKDVIKQLKEMSWAPFALAAALNISMKFLNAAKLRLLFPPPRPPLQGFVVVNFITAFFGYFIPGGVGAEVARWAYLGDESGSKSRALAAILLDRMTGLWSQIFLALAAWLWLGRRSMALWLAGPVAVLVLAASLWAGIWGYRRLTWAIHMLGIWFARRRGEKGYVPEDIGAALDALMSNRRLFLKVVGLSLFSHFIVVGIFILIDRSLGGSLGWAHAIFFLFCYTVVLFVPVTIGNLGLSEGTLGLLYHYVGSQSATGVLFSILLRVVKIPPVLIGWYLFLTRRSREAAMKAPGTKGRAGT